MFICTLSRITPNCTLTLTHPSKDGTEDSDHQETLLDGEYRLLGRKPEDTQNIFIRYRQGPTRTMNITSGAGSPSLRLIIRGLLWFFGSAFNCQDDLALKPTSH